MLKGKLRVSSSSVSIRKGLVVFQFALSIIMIDPVQSLYSINYPLFGTGTLGLDKENILCIKLVGDANKRSDALRNQLQQNSDILSVSRSEPMNSSAWGNTLGVFWSGKPQNENKTFWILHTDYDLASTFNIEMSRGRFYSREYPSDKTNAFVINESCGKINESKITP